MHIYIVWLYPIIFTKDIIKAEDFLLKNKKNPTFHLIYAMANKQDQEVDVAIERVLAQFKNNSKQALFKTMVALYKGDFETAKEQVDFIEPIKYLQSYQAAIHIEEGNIDEARVIAENISSKWMKYTLLSEYFVREGLLEKAIVHAKLALSKTKGVQKHTLSKEFSDLLREKDVL